MSDAHPAVPAWANLPDEELLNVRFCDLRLDIKQTPLEHCIQTLYQELEHRGISFRPVFYLGDEWFSPDGIPAISIPFYLAHPRLKQLEKKIMLEVEGDTEAECMKLLRHETGHSLCHAFHLPRRRSWRKTFGSPSKEFKDFYHYQPYSRSFVRHLENCYAQSHPEEDFAETFAVWLAPAHDWKQLYRGWPALQKLEYVDRLMSELKHKQPVNPSRGQPYSIGSLRRRLRTHYDQRRKFYAEDDPALFDSDLRRIFTAGEEQPSGLPASRFLRQQRQSLLGVVPFWTRERKYTVNRLLKKLAARCDELKLRLPKDEHRTGLEITAYLTALVSNYLFTGKFKGRV
ncbi:MAG: putative zinc-binding metallopeptidase [candidate division FCPU426 bacterium]